MSEFCFYLVECVGSSILNVIMSYKNICYLL